MGGKKKFPDILGVKKGDGLPVSIQERRAVLVPRINRLFNAGKPFVQCGFCFLRWPGRGKKRSVVVFGRIQIGVSGNMFQNENVGK